MLIAVPKESIPLETRVALVPKHIAELTSQGINVQIEHHAGINAGFSDKEYQQAGAKICATAADTYASADIITKIWAPQENEIEHLSLGQTILCNTRNISSGKTIKKFSQACINLFALDLIPRLSRTQSLDILSSQNNLDGYEAVIIGAANLKNTIPLLITSAGSLPPLKTLVMGLGVAGLQAIATARRLGAQVYGYDTRPETQEQAQSLGATFIKELTTDLLSSVQLIITSAQIKGKPAPKLLSKQQLHALSPLCVIIDLAADSGGNIIQEHLPQGTTLIRDSHMARRIPCAASTMYSGNIYNFCQLLIKDNQLNIDFSDEIIIQTMICCHTQSHHPYL